MFNVNRYHAFEATYWISNRSNTRFSLNRSIPHRSIKNNDGKTFFTVSAASSCKNLLAEEHSSICFFISRIKRFPKAHRAEQPPFNLYKHSIFVHDFAFHFFCPRAYVFCHFYHYLSYPAVIVAVPLTKPYNLNKRTTSVVLHPDLIVYFPCLHLCNILNMLTLKLYSPACYS